MDPLAMLERAIGGAERLVASLRPDELGLPTPCADWDVRQLVTHMIGTNYGFARALGASTPADVGATPPADREIGAAYAASARAALDAWRAPGALDRTLTLPFGQMPAREAIGFNVGDQLVHTWDLAKATGRDRTLDAECATAVLEAARQRLSPEVRRPGGPFGPEVPCPEDAPLSDRLAAFLGRTP